WSIWLEELQRAERVMVGVASDKRKPIQQQQASGEIGALFGQLIGVGLTTVVLLFCITYVLTTPDFVAAVSLIAVAVIGGFLGWIRLARQLLPDSQGEVGIFVTFGLLFYLITSGIPFRYYTDPPTPYLLAALALIFPLAAIVSWQGGGWVGKNLAQFIWRLTHADEEELKQG
ncbi:MAG: hypothetical protein H7X77_09415, partial [Anaerolineae bacterium]|nr:hypothetical protein [Anaerolineae bacterium]